MTDTRGWITLPNNEFVVFIKHLSHKKIVTSTSPYWVVLSYRAVQMQGNRDKGDKKSSTRVSGAKILLLLQIQMPVSL